MIVNYPMWLWTDAAQFLPVLASVTVQTPTGPLSLTVTAEPLRLVFDPGEPDSSLLTCAGPGQAWRPALGEHAESACMYTYRHSSEITDTDLFPARWISVWKVTWASNFGGGGVLDEEFLTVTDQPMNVREIQAVITD